MVTISRDTYSIMIWSLFLSAGGILLVWRTLRATQAAIRKAEDANSIARDSLDETRRVNVLQLQPWVTIGNPTVKILNASNGAEPIFTFTIPITNDGLTPISCNVVDFSEYNSLVIIFDYQDGKWPFIIEAGYITKANINPINPKSTYKAEVSCTLVPEYEGTPNFDLKKHQFDWQFCGSLRFKDLSTTEGTHRCISFAASEKAISSLSETKDQSDGDKFDFLQKRLNDI